LNDDFDDDGAPGGGLELEPAFEKGSGVGHAGAASTYGGSGGLDFDDDDDAASSGPLELDMPNAPKPSAAPPVPDLAVRSAPPPRPPGPLPARSGPHASGPAPAPPASVGPSVPPASRSGSHTPAPAPPSSAPSAGPSAPAPSAVSARPSGPTPAALVARYPAPPTKVWESPVYFLRVLLRQIELRQDLTALRRRRSPDVPLYEAALRAYDKRTYVLGLALTCAGASIALFVFFLPVFRRFLWND